MTPVLKKGDSFPDLHVESREDDVVLSDRWRKGPLVVAFMRHFGCGLCTISPPRLCLPPIRVTF